MSESFESRKFLDFKFKELKVYSSTEWLDGNQKKYRQVFDRKDVSYIYAEMSFFNKNFDIKEWEVEIEFKCVKVEENKNVLICKLPFKKTVSKRDPIFYLREGWGTINEGTFWKEGVYYWQAWINGKLYGTKYFYIEDSQTLAGGKFFEIVSAKLFEGQFDEKNDPDKPNYKVFSSEETRYVHVALELTNKLTNKDWQCELFFKFFNEAKELKGQVTRLVQIEKGKSQISVNAGWGNNNPSSWRKGKYSLEIVHLDRLVATVNFEVDSDFVEGVADSVFHYNEGFSDQGSGFFDGESFDEVMSNLERLIGLAEIKTKVKEHASYLKFLQLRIKKGFDDEEKINLHSVFTGNPGTGKTTVARLMGRLYHKMGLLSSGHVHEVDRVDLIGEYIGQTAPKIKEAIKRAKGGILFIDEAYSLARSLDDNKDFGREVIEILVKEMSQGDQDFGVIVAGYPAEMKVFIESNPGLRSRFKHYFEFKDYLPQELIEIAALSSREKQVVFTPEAQQILEDIIVQAYRNRDKSFGNARFVNDLIDRAKINLGIRIMERKHPEKLSPEDLMTITVKDMKRLNFERKKQVAYIPIDEELLQLALRELDSLIAIEPIKKQIYELVEVIRYHKEAGRDVVNNYSFHTVLVGNPGTGKTTVARILAKIYKALGILERGQMIETDRQGLVAGFVGQTAIKTAERIEEAMGGVLFIDEAYALSNFNGLQGDYGNEAIQTILKRMEDHRGEFFVFVAGYPDNMDRFLKANPGLASRFDKTLRFDDYTPQQLFEIGEMMLKSHGLRFTSGAKRKFSELMDSLHMTRDKYFGNARVVRKIILDLIKKQNFRLAKMAPGKISTQAKNTISEQDIAISGILDQEKGYRRPGIGF